MNEDRSAQQAQGFLAQTSFAQRRLWTLNQIEPGSSFYNTPVAVRLRGTLRVEALQSSIRYLVERHEALRTTLRERDGELIQFVHLSFPIPLTIQDVAEGTLQEAITAEADLPFDLARGPLLRTRLLRSAPDDHVLVLTMHHIVSDGWSMGVLVRDLLRAYAAFSGGGAPDPPKLEVQYADFAAWQRKELAGTRLEALLAHWNHVLRGAPTALELPSDRARPPVQRPRGSHHEFTLPLGVVDRAKSFGQRQGATLFMTLFAPFAALVARYTRQHDFIVGTPIANRSKPELEELIGFFVNMLALRVDLEGEPTGEELLARVKSVALDAFTHQDLPFERLVEELNPPRDQSRSPLVQIVFVLQNAPVTALELDGLEFSVLPATRGTSKFDMIFELNETATGIGASIEYNSDLFDDATMARFASAYVKLLDGFVARPKESVFRLPLLDDGERDRILRLAETPAPPARPASTLHELFEARVDATPDAIAVSDGEAQISYAELDARANRLARHLRARGVRPDEPVALLLERSADIVVAILAVLKAGACYLPLDPVYPPDRIRFTLLDAGARFLVTHRQLSPPSDAPLSEVIDLDRDAEALGKIDSARPTGPIAPDSLAYVIYTSGSTGKPKGTLISHDNVVKLFFATESDFGFGPGDVWTLFHSYAFDFSVWELWGALAYGGRLVIVPYLVSRSPELFADLVDEQRVTVLNQTPSAFHQFMQADEATPRSFALRWVVFGGEALELRSLRPWFDRHGDTSPTLVNMYGITETTVHVTFRPITAADASESQSLIGLPLPGVTAYLLDPHGNPVPEGVPAELFVGGSGVARGYLARPELSSQRFLPDPFSSAAGARLYRTGDLARLRNGQLDYLGRIDHQVKIRGFRIELGEIEAALADHPDVRHSVVLAREDVPGDKRLVAYVVPRRDAARMLPEETRREHVAQWQALYDDTYANTAHASTPQFDITGWNSSYTGLPIPQREMREWVDETVSRILQLRPRSVLELGCGTGLLLFRVAPHTLRYDACDISQRALDSISRHADGLPIALRCREAGDFEGVEEGAFDLVVVNSVIQYFAGPDYLLRVIEGAVRSTAAGGRIFVGDVRNAALMEPHHTAIVLGHAAVGSRARELRNALHRSIYLEEELVVDPAFFRALSARIPRLSHVRILPKAASSDNELSRYRYDVVLELDGPKPVELDFVDWRDAGLDLDRLRALLSGDRSVVALSAIPNERIRIDRAIASLLATCPDPRSLEQLQESARATEPEVRPEDLIAVAKEVGWTVELSWSGTTDGAIDAVFTRNDAPGLGPIKFPATKPESGAALSSEPLQAHFARYIVGVLRKLLADRLPSHMVPSALVVLDRLPMTPNGKIDRDALPAPEIGHGPRKPVLLPRNPTEEALVALWVEVLGVTSIGVQDNFFELGGHSLLATRLLARARELFAVELSLRALFLAPTVEGLARYVDEARASAGGITVGPITPAPRDRELPLSFAQERLWLLEQLEPGTPRDNMPIALRLEGDLDVDVLEKSIRALVERHETLRTTFVAGPNGPTQVIGRTPSRVVAVEDFRGRTEDDFLARIAGEGLRPLDISRGPLFRATLLLRGERDHVLLFVLHHIVGDGWSFGILVRELVTHYEALRTGETAILPPLSIQYADYAVWERSWLQGAKLEEQIAFWKRELDGAPPLELPSDKPRPAVQSPRGDRFAFELPRRLVEDIRALGRDEGATTFMILLAALHVLLSRYSGQKDISIGSITAVRPRPELEAIVGYFINVRVIRARLEDIPFGDFLAEIKEASLSATAHQDVPFEFLISALAPTRDLSRAPLTQVLFGLHNEAIPELRLDNLAIRTMDLEHASARVDLALDVTETDDGFVCWIDYSTDLFERRTIECFAAGYRTLLESIVADVETKITELSLTTAAARDHVLEAWTKTESPPFSGSPVPARIGEQAERTPNAVAIRSGDKTMTYAELWARATTIAARLLANGVQPEARVGLCAARSPDMIAGMLGIMLAGAAYVPIDPSVPASRIEWVLQDSNVAAVVVDRLAVDAVAKSGRTLVTLETVANEPPPRTSLMPRLHERNVAYVIYTSGSTGRPKGTLVEHRSLASYVDAFVTAYRVVPSDRMLQFASIAFDTSAEEIYPTLCAGATLVLRDDDMISSPAAFFRECEAREITLLDLPTAYWHQLVDAVASGEVAIGRSLRLVILGGEKASAQAVTRWLAATGGSPSLVNTYGPTEATIVATSARLTSEEAERGREAPIGRPVDRARAYVVDEAGRLVHEGVPGELCIAGEGVTRGYLGRPDLTADRFVPEPFSGEHGARMYRTGDRARFRSDGQLEFLGRLDAQVKIRGFRVELGEIEAVLESHPAIAQAVTVLRQERLVAYVVPRDGTAPPTAALEAHVRTKLPDYMVPSAILTVDTFPLTSNGKIDKSALPSVDPPKTSGRTYVAARNDVEQALAEIWQEVLGVERVGVHDHFFELGGHSLLAMRVVSAVRARLKKDLALRSLFEAPVLERLADRLSRSDLDSTVAIVKTPRGGPVACSHAQARLWVLDQLSPGSAMFNIPAAMRLEGPLDVTTLEEVVGALEARHEILRTTYLEVDGVPMQLVHGPRAGRIEVVDASEDRVGALATEEASAPFDLQTGPIYRVRLLRLGADTHVLLFTIHHIASDGWSLGVIARDVAALYRSARGGPPSDLPELTIQYADYALWQRQRLTGGTLQQLHEFWIGALRGAPPELALPTDRPRPQLQTAAGARRSFSLPSELTERARALGRERGATLFMVLLAAFDVLLCRLSGQRDIVVGTPVANRSHVDVEPLVGFFINALALRTKIERDDDFLALVERVKNVSLGAFAHQELSFDRVVEELNPTRDLSRSPLFQVMFALQNAPSGSFDLGGVKLSAEGTFGGATKFDLTVELFETGSTLTGFWEYNTDLFDETTIARWTGHFERLLAALLDRPNRSVLEAPLLSPGERSQLVDDFNDTRIVFPEREMSVHDLIDAQVARTPKATALVFEDEVLSFEELSTRANRLANHLVDIGVRPGDVVAVCFERSFDLVVSILAILKAGAAYLPLDPEYPKDRLVFMLQDSAAPCLLAHSSFLSFFPRGTHAVVLDELDLGDVSSEAPKVAFHPDSLAYVIYTSGSTGKPKGAANSHRAIVNRLLWGQRKFPLTETDAVVQKTPCSFDISVWEFFWPLFVGARLVLARPGGHKDPAYLTALFEAQRVTVAHFVPSMLRVYVDAVDDLNSLPLRLVFCTGEALPLDLAQTFLARSSASLHNLYGPTEAAVEVAWFPCIDLDAAWSLPIGRPIDNSTLLILDEWLEPLPIGVAGELFIGGIQLAHAYLARPSLTAEKFIPDPFSDDPGARLYRTGDLARQGRDGNIDFLGRLDHQIKLRGIRIELGEIEAAILQHPLVADTVVVPHDFDGDTRLVAYIVPSSAPPPTLDDLRATLATSLPELWIPTALVVLEALPLTPNGKLDRKALPAPDALARARVYAPPTNPVEETLCRLFAETLRLPRVGIHDNFFELGGHSLLAIRLVSAIVKATDARIGLRTVFEAPDVARLALRLAPTVDVTPSSTVLLSVDGIVNSRPPMFLFHLIGGSVFSYLQLAQLLDRPVYGVRSTEREGATHDELLALGQTIEGMVAAYVRDIVATNPAGPYLLAGWSAGGILAYEAARQLQREGREAAVVLFDSHIDPPSSYIDPFTDAAIMHEIVWEWLWQTKREKDVEVPDFASLPKEQWTSALATALGLVGSGSTPEEMVTQFFATFRAHNQAFSRFFPGPFGGPVCLIQGEGEGDEVNELRLAAWETLHGAPVERVFTPGLHRELMSSPRVECVATVLVEFMDRFERGRSA